MGNLPGVSFDRGKGGGPSRAWWLLERSRLTPLRHPSASPWQPWGVTLHLSTAGKWLGRGLGGADVVLSQGCLALEQ